MSHAGGTPAPTPAPAPPDTKRSRRRGASGRAAALRRAPSDSDCSAETASLSADSAERAPRVAPPPPRALRQTRAAKGRSRRRGSEWEVLEGLKDGQRFERRPDVFTGYLHKKRKWPLKGWHKRFFVVDGGILVYARSGADVARGRLHGSVDVGLSVISAKARRRRIDIDADEFIYHLRAKTPELFRTWLNVLKTHRLYRQHLLTFGAREAPPARRTPLDALPPADASDRLSRSSASSTMSSSDDDFQHETNLQKTLSDDGSLCSYVKKADCSAWLRGTAEGSRLIPLTFESLEENNFCDHKNDTCEDHKTLCSFMCIAKKFTNIDLSSSKSPDLSLGTTKHENQTLSADVDVSPPNKFDELQNMNSGLPNTTSNAKRKRSLFLHNKIHPTAAYYFFTRKKTKNMKVDTLKRSLKSTNLFKYRNHLAEPTLKQPISKCMLLEKYRLRKAPTHPQHWRPEQRAVACDAIPKEHDGVQATVCDRQNKSLQHVVSASKYDDITEKMLASLFHKVQNTVKTDQVKHNISEVMKDLYDSKLVEDENPIKLLFRSLLEYWLKNTSLAYVPNIMTYSKSVDRQSNRLFTKDENLSSIVKGAVLVTRGTQCRVLGDLIVQYKTRKPNASRTLSKLTKIAEKNPPACPSPKRDTESFEKERRIQELERLLKNTVYVCETAHSNKSKEKDIKITKALIDNMEKFSKKSFPDRSDENSNSSTEKIQETINRLISDTSLTRGIAKEFLSAYLDVLRGDSKSTNTTSQSSVASVNTLACDVQTEAIVKKVSKSITTFDTVHDNTPKSTDDTGAADLGQLYLKDVLDKITTIFSRINKKLDGNCQNKDQTNKDSPITGNVDPRLAKNERENSVKENIIASMIYENHDGNSLVIDLSKYNLEQISMASDPDSTGIMSISIQLKEKLPMTLAPKRKQTVPKIRNAHRGVPKLKTEKHPKYLLPKNKLVKNDFSTHKALVDISKEFDLKQFLSNSDATSKAYRVVRRSDRSLDFSFRSSSSNQSDGDTKQYYDNEDAQSCYIMSFRKRSIQLPKVQTKKKVRLKESEPPAARTAQLTVFERPAPRTIDEKFILLLLENLVLLSKTVPSLHKDINALYSRLRKKHEKVVKHCCDIQGLSLLGKIYSEDAANAKDVATQRDGRPGDDVNKTDAKDVSVGTGGHELQSGNKIDVNLSSMRVSRAHAAAQTAGQLVCSRSGSSTCYCERSLLRMLVDPTGTDRLESVTAEQATSNPNWVKVVRGQSVSTVIQCVIGDERTARPRQTTARPIHWDRTVGPSPKPVRGSDEMVTVLSPARLAAAAAQTDQPAVVNNTLGRDFHVCRLRVSGGTAAVRDRDESASCRTLHRCSSDPSHSSAGALRGPQAGFVCGTPGGRLAGWIVESGTPLEGAMRALGQAQLSVQQLQRLLHALDLQQQLHHDTDVSAEGASPSVKKDRRKFGLRKKKSAKGGQDLHASLDAHLAHLAPASHAALSALPVPPSPGAAQASAPTTLPVASAAARPQSLPAAEALGGAASLTSLTPDHQLREDFAVLAKDLLASLKGVVATLVCERGRLRAALDAADAGAPGGAALAALRTDLADALQLNSELRSRLTRIHDASDLAELSSAGRDSDVALRQFQPSLSYSSSCVSASEFFDAEENDDEPGDRLAGEAGVIELDGDSSSEAGSLSSEDGSASSDNSDVLAAEPVTLRAAAEAGGAARRTRLPAPRPSPGGPSLWNLLYKNIGKDLSQISMPVSLNEPLNMLQRLCEELEYCELLDAAAGAAGADRAALVAAFAVSAYAASAHRAASKPFNPLLGETYECVRADRGFRFLAEQVSHHPPVSACHAESPRWLFWQEARIKTKFWGKSMEFQPAGRVHVRLLPAGDHYTWNKVTTCVHNLFGGQRWVDQYGDMLISCPDGDVSCKLNFVKASAWSGSRHEVRGTLAAAGARVRLAGRWSEALFAGEPPATRLLWRPAPLPPDHELYYGFTRFAMELNELEPGLRPLLPPTDTRLRPDQRALEDGDVAAAERLKLQLEQAQRERRHTAGEHRPAWFRRSTEDGEETWVFGGEYWTEREAGFPHLDAPAIW